MEYNIGIITFAEDKEKAQNRALLIVKDMTDGAKSPFYDGHLDDKTVLAGLTESQIYIKGKMELTRKEFISNMKKVRKLLSVLTDEEMADNEYLAADCENEEEFNLDTWTARHYMFKAGQDIGPGIYLYDNDGEGIRTKEHLYNVLDNWGNTMGKDKVFITPFKMQA